MCVCVCMSAMLFYTVLQPTMRLRLAWFELAEFAVAVAIAFNWEVVLLFGLWAFLAYIYYHPTRLHTK